MLKINREVHNGSQWFSNSKSVACSGLTVLVEYQC